jgi:hypothetical protein
MGCVLNWSTCAHAKRRDDKPILWLVDENGNRQDVPKGKGKLWSLALTRKVRASQRYTKKEINLTDAFTKHSIGSGGGDRIVNQLQKDPRLCGAATAFQIELEPNGAKAPQTSLKVVLGTDAVVRPDAKYMC